ncbi:reverse transcriptase [Cucumis melo var. makuwa]|uniref:Reverse transcriptase n=1 Tax=Cucumis melo var. makuwa TaxID=1194695 RepID=A0A5A7TA20_CUCMM|nr:reverse transcriptase [Cucumis melo var. makuwa]
MCRHPLILLPILSTSTRCRRSNCLTLPIIRHRTRRPSPPDKNLQNCQICKTVQICPSTICRNLSFIGTGLTNTITDRGLKQTSHRHPSVMDNRMFVVSGLIKPIEELFLKLVHPWHRPMYSMNPVISLPNVPSNYITNFVAFSAQSLTYDNGKPILVCEHCKKQRHTKDQCWKLHGWPPRGNKCSSNEQQNLGRIDVRETASTSQPIGPTASQTNSPTLSAIAQSGFSEHFVSYTPYAGNEKIWIADGSLVPIAGKGQIVLFDATFLPESICFQDLNSGRTIGTARHNRGLYILNDDTSAAHLKNRMPSCILHLQTPLECLKESYPSTCLISEAESVSEESNSSFEFIEPTPSTVFDIDPHPIILPINQVPWKKYYRRNLRKEVRSPTSQPLTLVQDSKPPRDQGIKNPTEPCTNNTMNENDMSDVAVLENVEEKNSGDETEVRTETCNNEAEQSHTGKLDKAFTASLDSTTIPKNIHIALECPEWKNVVMEEMKALEMNNTWEICALPKIQKLLNIVRVLLFVAVTKNAFLNGDLVEKVYISPPPGFEAQFTTFVKSQGYSQGHSDHTLFTKVFETGRSAVLIVYVDDIVLSEDDQAEISQLNQFMQAPYEEHMEAVKRILKYLKTTPSKGLMFRKTDKKTIEAYTDSDWAGSVVDRMSTSGYCTFVWGNLVTVVARRSVEAEYRLFNSGSICILYIPSSQHVADVLTKGLLRPNFDFCVSKLSLIDIYVPT